MSMITLLIVDDDETIRKLMVAMLRDAGYALQEAADGVQALAAISTQTPDVVLLDILMPSMNGLVLLDHLRHNGLSESVPIIAMTGTMTEERTIKELGARGVLRKPFTRQQLTRAIDAVLQRGAMNDERPGSNERSRTRGNLLKRLGLR